MSVFSGDMSFEQMPSMERAERPKEKLDRLMGELALKVNSDLGEDVLNQDSTMDSRRWEVVYGEEDIEDDARMAKNKELEWSAATNDRTRQFYKDQYHWTEEGQELTDKIVGKFIEKREASNPALLEKAVTVIFHKVMGDKFVVMRSSKHDDYENGVDNIIVNKETGDVACAFDEVHGETKHGGQERKEEKIRRKAQKGGARIKYGLTFEQGEDGEKHLVKKEIRNVPAFYISLEPHDLQEVMANLSGHLDDRPSEAELKVFDQFIASLEGQIEILKNDRLPQGVAQNIASFQKSLVGIKELRKRF